MKALARSYNGPEQHFKAAIVLLDLRQSQTQLTSNGTITIPHKTCMIFIDDNVGGGTLTLNNTVTIKTARNQQAYRIPFEITSWAWGGMASPTATSNVTIIGFN